MSTSMVLTLSEYRHMRIFARGTNSIIFYLGEILTGTVCTLVHLMKLCRLLFILCKFKLFTASNTYIGMITRI